MNGAGLGAILQWCGCVVGVEQDQLDRHAPVISHAQGEGEVAHGIAGRDLFGCREVGGNLRTLGPRVGLLLIWGQERGLGLCCLLGAGGRPQRPGSWAWEGTRLAVAKPEQPAGYKGCQSNQEQEGRGAHPVILAQRVEEGPLGLWGQRLG